MRAPDYRPGPAHPLPRDTDRHVVVFDGGCAMCSRWIERLRRWDRDGFLEFIPFQDPRVPGRFPWIPKRAYQEAVQVVAPGGATWAGAAAAERLAHLLPGGRPMTLLFRIPGVRPVADSVYRWVARRRQSGGCELHAAPSVVDPGSGDPGLEG